MKDDWVVVSSRVEKKRRNGEMTGAREEAKWD